MPNHSRTNSLDDLNSETKTDMDNNAKSSAERLDSQISSLHQDVATLSMEVICVNLVPGPCIKNVLFIFNTRARENMTV